MIKLERIDSHIVLYAKGSRYEKSTNVLNVLEDLRTIIGKLCDLQKSHVDNKMIWDIVCDVYLKVVSPDNQRLFLRNLWRYGEFEQTGRVSWGRIVSLLLGEIAVVKVKDGAKTLIAYDKKNLLDHAKLFSVG